MAMAISTKKLSSLLAIACALAVSAICALALHNFHYFEWIAAPCVDQDCSRRSYFDWALNCLADHAPRWCAAGVAPTEDTNAPYRIAVAIVVFFGTTLGSVFWLIRRPDRDTNSSVIPDTPEA